MANGSATRTCSPSRCTPRGWRSWPSVASPRVWPGWTRRSISVLAGEVADYFAGIVYCDLTPGYAERRRTTASATRTRAAANPTKMPNSIHWNVQ